MKSYRRRGGHLGGELAGSVELGQDPLEGKLEGVRAKTYRSHTRYIKCT